LWSCHHINAFAAGGVYEDPATDATAAPFASYLRNVAWSDNISFEIFHVEDMGFPSRLLVEYQPEMGSSIKVSGEAR
jgi:predicted PhzF superfamily epimerase YddE/YHI9